MDTPQEEGTAPQETESPAASEQPDYFGEKFDPANLPPEIQPGYQQMRNAFHAKTQALAEERQALQSPQSLARMYLEMAPEAREAFFEQANLEYADAEQEDYGDYDDDEDPYGQQDARDPRVDALLAERQEQQELGQIQAFREYQLDVVNDGLDELEGKTGREFSQEEIDLIGDLAMRMLDDEGVPQVGDAYERIVQVEQGRRSANVERKRNLRQPGQGLPGDEKVDMSTPDTRRKALAAEIEAAQASEA
jgi:hypothetical protein